MAQSSSASAHIVCRKARHPMVDAALQDRFVPNDVRLHSTSATETDTENVRGGESELKRALVVTGPNMGGKSCYIRQVALIAIMAQVSKMGTLLQFCLKTTTIRWARGFLVSRVKLECLTGFLHGTSERE